MFDFSSDAVLMVLASELYDEFNEAGKEIRKNENTICNI